MTVIQSTPARRRDVPWPPLAVRPHRAPRLLAILVVSIVVIGLAGGTLAVARGQSAQMQASRDLGAARQHVDGALARARADGLTGTQLAAVRHDEARILSEAEVPNRLVILDAGQADHLSRQAGALRALLPRIDLVRSIATDHDRQGATALLDDFDSAIAAASQAGLDETEDERRAAQARHALLGARSPAAVSRATAHIAERSGVLRDATAAKVAEDAAEAELSSRQSQAQHALTGATQLLSQAQAIPQLQIADLKSQLDQAQAAFAAASSADDFRSVAAAAGRAAAGLRTLLRARAEAYQELTSARQTVQQATDAKVDPGAIPAQLDAISAQLDAAGTTDQFRSLNGQMSALIAPLADRLGIAELGPGKVIVVNLGRQDLTAYQDGQVLLTSLVTTGRPALPTPPGSTTVMSKSHPWRMVSDWPQSSPFWYPPSDVTFVLWFRSGGYGIHDAPWRSTYGPGTEAQGSHGCVNVPLGKMETLYNWADVGTRVIVQ